MLAILIIPIILVFVILVGIFQKNTNASCKSKKRLDGRTVLVTGGTAGMGLEIATEMARRGARVIIACPFPEEGNTAQKQIVQTTGNHNVEFQLLDLSSLECTRRFAADFLAREPQLDILINNAGIGGSTINKSADGINFVMQVNYFGTFQLTLLLLPLLKKTGRPGEPSRILNTASVLHMLGVVDIDNLSCRKITFTNTEYYADSKFCVVLFTMELARRLRGENVVVNSVDPGAVGTKIFYGWGGPLLGSIIMWLCVCFFKTPWQGAQTALHVALDDAAGAVSGMYFKNCQPSRAIFRAYNDTMAKQVWEESLRIVELYKYD